jgi:hypothetical protein
MANVNEVPVSLNGSLPLSSIVQVTDRVFAIDANTEVTAGTPYVTDFFSNYNAVTINGTVYSNLAGTVSFECSDDGITWDVIETWAVTASTALAFTTPPYGALMRFAFNPTSGTTSTFRFSAYAIGIRSL